MRKTPIFFLRIVSTLILALILSSCSSAQKAHEVDPNKLQDKVATSVLIFYKFKSNFSLSDECDITLESLEGKGEFSLELKTAQTQQVAEIPAGKYAFREIRCSATQRYPDLSKVLNRVIQVHEGKINFIADCIFEFTLTLRKTDLMVIIRNAADVAKRLERFRASLDPKLRSSVVSAY